jgi:hypothetical protein
VEKRRSPRYQCEGSVEMGEIDCDVHTWASFTDLACMAAMWKRRLLASSPSMIMGRGIASTLPARGPLELPAITNPDAVVQGLQDFFRDRQKLMRDDFVRIVRQSQNAVSKS